MYCFCLCCLIFRRQNMLSINFCVSKAIFVTLNWITIIAMRKEHRKNVTGLKLSLALYQTKLILSRTISSSFQRSFPQGQFCTFIWIILKTRKTYIKSNYVHQQTKLIFSRTISSSFQRTFPQGQFCIFIWIILNTRKTYIKSNSFL